MLLQEVDAAYHTNHAKLTNSMRGQNEKDMNVVTQLVHRALTFAH